MHVVRIVAKTTRTPLARFLLRLGLMAAARPRPLRVPEPEPWTLLDLVQAVAEATEDDGEVVATVLYLLRTGSVRLVGSFRGERL